MSALRVVELTAPGRGALSVLELRGVGALLRVRSLCPGASLAPGRLALARLEAHGEALDEALVVVHAPDHVELHLHGSPVGVRGIRELLCAGSSEPAAASLEERAARVAACAPGEAGARIALDQAEGALRRELEAIVAAPDEEQDRRLDALLRGARVARRALEPALILLLGPTNAGKSTLFNALVGEQRALVSAEPGTTRDVVVARARLGDYPVDLVDGPGERERPAAEGDRGASLEREGGRQARALVERAALVAWLSPLTRCVAPPADLPAVRLVTLATLADRSDRGLPDARRPALCALHRPTQAVEVVTRAFLAALELPEQPWVPGAPALFGPALVEQVGRARAARAAGRARLLARILEPSAARNAHGS